MFSVAEKRLIAQKLEEVILSLNHPEMPNEKPRFKLHVDGAESWSFADIEPNWTFDDRQPGVNQWNEQSHEEIAEKKPVIDDINRATGNS